ncbi:PC4-domain-containing protein [Hyaloscypha bicolor E]|uniref:PC4-domain-containing protein n=1 Tax=Hyaloscypha bicolor E TaxID=1095630 RepID=A0A2J6T1Y4_9HELO|nr:PC4-domain-containing protein [Hyaloscypha bicolor E]PMD57021.1 PC4-domain-containing protein [Hyaloscypha bicolor E]
MVKSSKRGRDEADTYEADDFVEDDDGSAPKSKKSRKAAPSSSSKSKNKFFDLSSGRTPRRVEVSDFKGSKLVNIREYYEKDEEWLPGKKGISLSIDQYKALLKAIPAINAQLKDMGIVLGESADAMDEDEPEEETKPQKRIKGKKTEKANIEATSDEDGDED